MWIPKEGVAQNPRSGDSSGLMEWTTDEVTWGD